jgi:hypothetical protein
MVDAMASSLDNSGFDFAAFDRVTDPIFRILTIEQARDLAQYRGDESLQHRIEELAAKCNEGKLSPAEQAEYEAYVRANKFVAIVQAKARKVLADKPDR